MSTEPPVCIAIAAFWYPDEMRWGLSGYVDFPSLEGASKLLVDCEYGPFDTWHDVRRDVHEHLDQMVKLVLQVE